MNNYTLADEEKEHGKNVNLLNIFLVYYRNLFQKNTDLHMFQDINYFEYDSTNRHMELFYNELIKYKEKLHDEDKTSIYPIEDIDIDDCEELYVLKYDGKEYGCQYIIPLMSLLSEYDWLNNDWELIPIKTNHD